MVNVVSVIKHDTDEIYMICRLLSKQEKWVACDLFWNSTFTLYYSDHTNCSNDRKWFRHEERGCTRETATSTNVSHFVLFINHWISIGFFFRFSTRSMFLLPKLLYTQAGRHIHTVQRHTDIKSGGSFLLLHPALPLPPSLARRSILLLISWLHICLLVFFFFAVFFYQ